KLDASSFPSWHTARALFLALIFSEKFNYFPLTVFLITITVIVAYSRLYLKKHDIIDVLGGIVLGGVSFWLAVKLI
ncbi:phosphatase PAP2 family protein, partial [Candidatus Woesearchaeota archaeon]|nr:phosphatase PAP2 family protein [Candidatus Woesearchaeota archaeon]